MTPLRISTGVNSRSCWRVYVLCLLFVGVGFDLVVTFRDRFLFLVNTANGAEGFAKDVQGLATIFIKAGRFPNGAEGVAKDVQGLASMFLKGHVSGVCSAKFSNKVIFFNQLDLYL